MSGKDKKPPQGTKRDGDSSTEGSPLSPVRTVKRSKTAGVLHGTPKKNWTFAKQLEILRGLTSRWRASHI